MEPSDRRYLLTEACENDWEDAMELAWKTFQKFEAPDYCAEGIQNFLNFISDASLYNMFAMGAYRMFVAKDDEKIIGVISVRSRNHISLLFVDEKYHRTGIGRALIQKLQKELMKDYGLAKLTVHAAPYAAPFYRKIGFTDLDTMQLRDGIKYIPMSLDKVID